MSRKTLQNCIKCSISLSVINRSPKSNVCRPCKNRIKRLSYEGKKQRLSTEKEIVHKTNKNITILSNLNALAIEIVKNYKIKSSLGVICACKDLHKYCVKNRINPYLNSTIPLEVLMFAIEQVYIENLPKKLLSCCTDLHNFYIKKKIKIREVD